MKLRKILLLGALAVMAAFCLIPGLAFADETESEALSFSEEGYCHINSGSYYLKEDVSNGAILITGNTADDNLITIDLNGHWLKQTDEVYRNGGTSGALMGTIYLKASSAYKVNVKIINSKPESGGIVQNFKRNAIYLEADSGAQSPKLTLDGVNVSTSYSKTPDNSLECLAIKGGEVTIDNSTLQIAPESLKAAIYIEPVSSNKLTVNSGSFSGSTREYSEDIINVGKRDGGKAEAPSIVLNGGTYNQVPVQATLGEGKYIYQSGTDEYMVDDNHDGYDHAVVPSALGGVWFKGSDSALAYKDTFKKTKFHTVSFVSSSKTSVPDQCVADGCKVAKPADPVVPAYVGVEFKSWQIDGADYVFDSKVTTDLTLVAKYDGTVALINGDRYSSLQAAISAATDGQTVELVRSTFEDVKLDDSSKKITLDLCGNVLYNKDNAASTITVKSGHLNVKDGLVKYLITSTEFEDTYCAIDLCGGSATLDNVNAYSSNCTVVYAESGPLQINGGTYCLNQCGIDTNHPAVLTVFGTNDAISEVTIDKATFKVEGEESAVMAYDYSTVTITDGSFDSALIRDGDGEHAATYSLQGGQYADMPSVNYVADGYVIYKPADPEEPEGATSPYQVVSTDSDLVKNAPAYVMLSGKSIYFESSTEAKAYALAHKDEGAVAMIFLTATVGVSSDATYDGSAKEATVSFDCEDAESDGVAAVVEYSDSTGAKLESAPVDAGTYTAKVTGLTGADAGTYKYELKSEASGSFTINQASAEITVNQKINKVLGQDDFNLNASVEPEIALSYSSKNEDVATVDQAGKVHIVAAGTATLEVSVKDSKNYKADTKEVTLTVASTAFDIATAEVKLKQGDCIYSGKQQKPELSEVTLNGAQLFEGTDFTVSYGENINAGAKAGTLTLMGAGDYTGTKTVSFDIKKAAATIAAPESVTKTVGDKAFNLGATVSTDVEGDGPALVYSSDNKSVAAVDQGGKVTIGVAGTANITVSIEEGGNFTAEAKQVALTVKAPEPAPTPVPADISAAKVTLSKAAFTYNGKAQKPSVKSVVLNGKTLKAGTDYTASVASGKKVGTYNVTVTAKGSYTGKATASFTVNPKGVTKFKVSKAKKSFKAKWKKAKAQRSGVQVKYSTKKSMAKAKTVKAKGASAKAKTVKKLKKKTKYYVQARTYKVVNGKTYYSSWSAKKAVKTK